MFHVRAAPYVFCYDTVATEIYTLSLHDALPICTIEPVVAPKECYDADERARAEMSEARRFFHEQDGEVNGGYEDRKSTRLNSSHQINSYAVFCLKQKTNKHGMLAPHAGQ